MVNSNNNKKTEGFGDGGMGQGDAISDRET